MTDRDVDTKSRRIRFASGHPLFGKKFQIATSSKKAFRLHLQESRAKTRGGVWWQMSPYYLWYECLRRSDRYQRCCEREGRGPMSKLYADFGDVRTNFRDWWRLHGESLFGEPPSPGRVQSISLTEIDTYRSSIESGQTLLVCVPADTRRSEASRDFRRVIRGWIEGSGKEGGLGSLRSNTLRSRAKYCVLSRGYMNVGAIRNDLTIYDMHREGGKWRSIADRMRTVDRFSWTRTASDAGESERIRVWRSRKNAEALIRGVEKGRFPVFD